MLDGYRLEYSVIQLCDVNLMSNVRWDYFPLLSKNLCQSLDYILND